MTELEYAEALVREHTLAIELKNIRKEILEYENKNKRPILETLSEVKEFIITEDQGSAFTYLGINYILDDFQEMIDDYGYMNARESIMTSTLDNLIGGGVNIIKVI